MSSEISQLHRVLVPVANAKAIYAAFGSRMPGFFRIIAKGHAPLHVGHIRLAPELHFMDGVVLKVMGTAKRPSPSVRHYTTPVYSFESRYHKEIFIRGANGIIPVPVDLLRDDTADTDVDALYVD
ncbi:hypothetical protein WS68_22555 [Burkholderia sp. TSV86]|nr:hypothetical protein WS68_22555 [Burkholderia sp. TSV86]